MALRGFTWGVKPRSGAPRPIDPLRRPVSTGAAGGGPTIGDSPSIIVGPDLARRLLTAS